MVLLNSPICDQEKVMPSFELMNIDGTVLKRENPFLSDSMFDSKKSISSKW